MLKSVLNLLNRLLGSKTVSIGSQIFQVGLLSTAWSFINNIIKTIQGNLFNIFLASLAS